MRATLVSKNRHKAKELAVLMPGWSVEPIDVDELPEETGATFYENARAKAAFGREVEDGETWTIGEDSGVEVDGPRRSPGDPLRPLRGAGRHRRGERDEAARRAGRRPRAGARGTLRLRARLPLAGRRGVPGQRDAGGRGSRSAPRGSEGFGYDPVFVPDGEELTVAELGDAWKAQRSHRAGAAAALLKAVGSAAPAR